MGWNRHCQMIGEKMRARFNIVDSSSHFPMIVPSSARHKGPGFKTPGGYLCGTGILLLALSRYIGDPWHDWSFLWPRLRRASSLTITRPSCWQCDNPTWSLTAFLSWFHARCRSYFQLHNRLRRLLEGSPVESLQSHFIPTKSHWSSRLPVCFPSQGTRVQKPRGVLMWDWDSPVSIVLLQAEYLTH
jgi:hypothetical protein